MMSSAFVASLCTTIYAFMAQNRTCSYRNMYLKDLFIEHMTIHVEGWSEGIVTSWCNEAWSFSLWALLSCGCHVVVMWPLCTAQLAVKSHRRVCMTSLISTCKSCPLHSIPLAPAARIFRFRFWPGSCPHCGFRFWPDSCPRVLTVDSGFGQAGVIMGIRHRVLTVDSCFLLMLPAPYT